mmetsp:Transcript_56539/g.138950  ORF Transcript_56539/g.138950 Transcript_56539/m.138950 type:complete len:84 (+) Transcript_56539:284-535(+)
MMFRMRRFADIISFKAWMLQLLVAFQIRESDTGHVAQSTRERFVVQMNCSDMPLKVAFLTKSLATDVTAMRFFACVYFHSVPQ